MNDVYVHILKLPLHINGCTMPNTDGTFDVYINENISEEKQLETLKHEIGHIQEEHFYTLDSASFCEAEIKKLLLKSRR